VRQPDGAGSKLQLKQEPAEHVPREPPRVPPQVQGRRIGSSEIGKGAHLERDAQCHAVDREGRARLRRRDEVIVERRIVGAGRGQANFAQFGRRRGDVPGFQDYFRQRRPWLPQEAKRQDQAAFPHDLHSARSSARDAAWR
jgi:hypothetical protein